MPKIIPGDGSLPCRLMIIGERPGHEEYEKERPFVGPAGQELWQRIWKILRIGRDAFYVTNLVKTFSTEPPSAEEISRDARLLQAELLRCRPTLILTIGYHAARALLPQFRGVKGDFFHGLAFPFTYGRLSPRSCTVIPVVHSSAALRQPDRYQNMLTNDLRAAKAFLDHERSYHVAKRPPVYPMGLANFAESGATYGVDTEGSVKAPECVTIAKDGRSAYVRDGVACIEVWEGKKLFLKPSLMNAKAIALHYALHDLKVLDTLHIRLSDLGSIHDTMIEAYLLDLPQSLKVLAYRELGYVMSDYEDLVTPIDTTNVRDALTAKLQEWETSADALHSKATRQATKAAKVLEKRLTKKAIAQRYKRLYAKSGLPEKRVISGLRRMIESTNAAAALENDDE